MTTTTARFLDALSTSEAAAADHLILALASNDADSELRRELAQQLPTLTGTVRTLALAILATDTAEKPTLPSTETLLSLASEEDAAGTLALQLLTNAPTKHLPEARLLFQAALESANPTRRDFARLGLDLI